MILQNLICQQILKLYMKLRNWICWNLLQVQVAPVPECMPGWKVGEIGKGRLDVVVIQLVPISWVNVLPALLCFRGCWQMAAIVAAESTEMSAVEINNPCLTLWHFDSVLICLRTLQVVVSGVWHEAEDLSCRLLDGYKARPAGQNVRATGQTWPWSSCRGNANGFHNFHPKSTTHRNKHWHEFRRVPIVFTFIFFLWVRLCRHLLSVSLRNVVMNHNGRIKQTLHTF